MTSKLGRFTCILALSMMFTAIITGCGDGVEERKKAVGIRTISSDEFGFTMQGPEGWLNNAAAMGYVRGQFTSPVESAEDACKEVIQVNVRDLTAPKLGAAPKITKKGGPKKRSAKSEGGKGSARAYKLDDKLVDEVFEDIKAQGKEIVELERASAQFGGQEATKVVYELSLGATTTKRITYFFVNGKNLYWVTGVSEPNAFDNYLSVFEESFKTFKLN